MPLIPLPVAVIVFGMFVLGIVALSVALRVKLHGQLEGLSRSTRWWVRGLVVVLLAAGYGIVLLFRHVMHV